MSEQKRGTVMKSLNAFGDRSERVLWRALSARRARQDLRDPLHFPSEQASSDVFVHLTPRQLLVRAAAAPGSRGALSRALQHASAPAFDLWQRAKVAPRNYMASPRPQSSRGAAPPAAAAEAGSGSATTSLDAELRSFLEVLPRLVGRSIPDTSVAQAMYTFQDRVCEDLQAAAAAVSP